MIHLFSLDFFSRISNFIPFITLSFVVLITYKQLQERKSHWKRELIGLISLVSLILGCFHFFIEENIVPKIRWQIRYSIQNSFFPKTDLNYINGCFTNHSIQEARIKISSKDKDVIEAELKLVKKIFLLLGNLSLMFWGAWIGTLLYSRRLLHSALFTSYSVVIWGGWLSISQFVENYIYAQIPSVNSLIGYRIRV